MFLNLDIICQSPIDICPIQISNTKKESHRYIKKKIYQMQIVAYESV